MTSAALADYYQSRANLEKLNPLIRSAYNTTTDFPEYKQKLLAKVDGAVENGSSSVLDSIEEVRREQRARLAQVEHDYYNLKHTQSFDLPFYSEDVQARPEPIVTSKPPLPTASRRSPSPVFVTEEHAHPHPHHQHQLHHRPISASIVPRRDDTLEFSPHYTHADETISSEHDLTNSHVQDQIHHLWNEFELDDYLEERK